MQISGVFLCCTCLWILFWNPRSISVCVSRSVCDNLNQGSYLFCKSKKKTTTQLLALSCLSCQYWLMHHLLGLLILMHGSTLVSCSEAGDIVSCNQICSTFKTQSTRELYSRLHQNQQMYKCTNTNVNIIHFSIAEKRFLKLSGLIYCIYIYIYIWPGANKD